MNNLSRIGYNSEDIERRRNLNEEFNPARKKYRTKEGYKQFLDDAWHQFVFGKDIPKPQYFPIQSAKDTILADFLRTRKKVTTDKIYEFAQGIERRIKPLPSSKHGVENILDSIFGFERKEESHVENQNKVNAKDTLLADFLRARKYDSVEEFGRDINQMLLSKPKKKKRTQIEQQIENKTKLDSKDTKLRDFLLYLDEKKISEEQFLIYNKYYNILKNLNKN